jgi:hypothetical protein
MHCPVTDLITADRKEIAFTHIVFVTQCPQDVGSVMATIQTGQD